MRQTAKSKRCVACGWPNGLQANACTFCGVSMAVRCPQCQFDNQTNARFCGGCGQPLNRNFSSDPPSPIQPHIGEAGAGALPSARKLITVVFADIHQSTAMVEKLDPEQAADQLDVAIAAMVESVHRFEGTINRIEGDGVMALFGAVRGQEDHAVHACHAALAILDAVQEATGQQVKVRVGVHTGNVVLRPVGNDLSVDLDIAGAA